MTQSRIPLAENISWERMIRAVEKVRERLLKATAALDQAGVLYAVVGGNAVASWVSSIDPGAVRNTRDVDLLVRRDDLPSVKDALTGAGFVYAQVMDVEMFLEGQDAKPSDGVHVLFAGEKVKADDVAPSPDAADSSIGGGGFRVLNLEALVRMKLISHRLKDRVHLQDLIRIGLVDTTWVARFPSELGSRLQVLIDDPTTYDI